MSSFDNIDKNIEKIGKLFPNCLTEKINESGEVESVIDFDRLKQELSKEIVEGNEERYQFTWPDKKKAELLASSPISKTLRPYKEESIDFDNTENLYIEGDNLEALKLLQETYLGKVKMIYIDPPYNTGKDFVYNDKFSKLSEEYKEINGDYDDEGNRLVQNLETNGRFHTDWLNMIYPRLKVARNLLSDDGVIFISIDDNEVHNLRKVCDEIFGEGNFIGELPTIMNLNGNNDSYGFVETHEYTLVYTKNKNKCEFGHLPVTQEELKEWVKDEYGYYKKADTLRRTGQDAAREKRPKGWFPVFITKENLVYVTDDDLPKNQDDICLYPLNEEGEELSWTWSKSKINNESYNLIVVEGRNGKNIYKKQRPIFGNVPTKKPKSLLYKPEYSTSTATVKLKKLLNKKIFEGSKPIPLIEDFLRIALTKEQIVLDFFSGSSTTAHAVMQLNAEDRGNRKFIMVQLPEELGEKSEAYKNGYRTICDIGKKRIIEAGKELKEKHPDLDTGFRVLKVDSSNMEDIYYQPKDIVKSLLDMMIDNIKTDRTPEDLLFQVMLDLGVPLSSKIEKITIAKKEVFIVANGYLIACFDKNITEEIIKEIALKKPYYFIMRDSSMANDNVATNFEQIFAICSPDTIKKVL